MTSDLLFSVLPREGKATLQLDEFRVEQVSKEAKLKGTNEEEQSLNAKERDAREKQQKQQQQAKQAKPASASDQSKDDDDGPIKHLDIYI